MSTDADEAGDDDPTAPVEITLSLGDDGVWVARDEETGVASQGESRTAALDNLDEAVALHRGDIGREPTEAELREVGIDPEENESGELPDVLE